MQFFVCAMRDFKIAQRALQFAQIDKSRATDIHRPIGTEWLRISQQ